jgi:hypothetical protein
MRNGVPRKLPVGASDAIEYPKKLSEFEIQAYIYNTLRAKGFDVRGEVTSRRGSAILDLVVFDNRRPVLIIEVKPSAPKRNWARVKVLIPENIQEQLDDYRRIFGLEVRLVSGMVHAKEFCGLFKDLLNELAGRRKVPGTSKIAKGG